MVPLLIPVVGLIERIVGQMRLVVGGIPHSCVRLLVDGDWNCRSPSEGSVNPQQMLKMLGRRGRHVAVKGWNTGLRRTRYDGVAGVEVVDMGATASESGSASLEVAGKGEDDVYG